MRLIDADVLKEALRRIIIPEMKRYRDRNKLLNILNKLNVAIVNAIDGVHTICMVRLQPHWIPVAEKLPEENGKYIVTACYDIWDSTVVMVAEYYIGSRTWYDECCECSLEGIVTHWMPMPEPPVENE